MKVHHVAISASNLEVSLKFYEDFFGFKKINEFTKPKWEGKAVYLQLGDFKLEIFKFTDNIKEKHDLANFKVIGFKHFAIEVDNVLEKYQELKDAGVDIDTPQKGVTCAWLSFLRDPDGIIIELIETLNN